MSWTCYGCGFNLFFAGYPDDCLCSQCRASKRKTGSYPLDAAAKKARAEREEIEADKIRRRTMKFRDGRRGADGMPSPSDWDY